MPRSSLRSAAWRAVTAWRATSPYLPLLLFASLIAWLAIGAALRPPPKPISPEMAAYLDSLGKDKPGQFHGYDCTTPDCAGEQAGYDWAEQAFARSPDTCTAKFGGGPLSRYRGCSALVDEHQIEAEPPPGR